MAFSTTYTYSQRLIFDIKTLFDALRFIIINAILLLIFLFLIFEEIDWAFFSFREKISDQFIDNTSWNIKTIL